jgi:hypothetical protein
MTLEDIYSQTLTLTEPCKIFEGKLHRSGYPVVFHNHKVLHLHKLAWELAGKTKRKEGNHLHHICFNVRCLNVKHLIEVTPAQHRALHNFKNTMAFGDHKVVDAAEAMKQLLANYCS